VYGNTLFLLFIYFFWLVKKSNKKNHNGLRIEQEYPQAYAPVKLPILTKKNQFKLLKGNFKGYSHSIPHRPLTAAPNAVTSKRIIPTVLFEIFPQKCL